MRASGITRYAGPFESFEVPTPQIAADHVLVKVAAAGIGLWDGATAAGVFGTDRPLPLVLGWEGSGVVEQVGADVTDLTVGEEVIGYDRSSAWYAEYTATAAALTVPKPAGLDMVGAAALPISGSTAWQSLVDVLSVQPGETVLITAAAGATGVLAVQLAKHLGATVVATAGPANLDYVRGLGADHVHDYTSGVDAVLDAVRRDHPHGVDVLLDAVSADNFAALLPAVRPGGRTAGITPPLHPATRDDITVHPITSVGDGRTLRQIVRLVDEGVLRVAVQDAFALEDVARAHDKLATRHGRGKIVLSATATG